jgi:hypothetical protein
MSRLNFTAPRSSSPPEEVIPEGELSCFVPDLCALEDWNHALLDVLRDRDSQSDGHNHKK